MLQFLHSLRRWRNIKKNIPIITLTVFVANLFLFGIKLYVGLASNSISIYSDGVNNLFDSLAGIISFIFLSLSLKATDAFSSHRSEKTEQLLNFIICIILGFSGFYFAYNSLERLFYPTPIWYQVNYLYLLCLTMAVKLVLFIFIRIKAKKYQSDILFSISFDSIVDFFITAFAVMSLVLSSVSDFAYDAYCGIAISIVIIIQAIKMIISAIRSLLGLPDENEKEVLEELLSDLPVRKVEFIFTSQEKTAVIHLQAPADTDKIKEEIRNQTDITAVFVC